jgi:aryl-alcohol dehydrogenase-like predicted oxidoreductase
MGMTTAYDPDAEADRPEDVIAAALDAGANLLDTSDVYGPFTNEELVGRAIAGRRDEAFVATKCGLVERVEGTERVLANKADPEHVLASGRASARRLGVDTLDLLQLHRVDPAVPLADTWAAMAELVRSGVTRAIGMSEVTVAQLQEAHAIHPVASVQSELSLWTRRPLDEVVPWCERSGARFIAYAPLGRGYLTGTLIAGSFGAGDLRAHLPRFTAEAMAQNQALLDVVTGVAGAHDASPGQVALAWVLAQNPCITVIPGTRRRRRLRENIAAADLVLTPEELRLLQAAPQPAQPRYPRAPREGRRDEVP